MQDALELSDDSDVEVHPNVDKRSFIRAKQNQIHQEREQRKMRIEALKYECLLHDGVLKRISVLLASFKSGPEDNDPKTLARLAFNAVMTSAGRPKDDTLPDPPKCLEADPKRPKTYSQLMVGVLDQVNKALDEEPPETRYQAMVKQVELQETDIIETRERAREEIAKLEAMDSSKITSDSIHMGFDSSHVNKSKSTGGESTQVELLNPNFEGASSSSDAKGKSIAEGGDGDGVEEASPVAKTFGKITSSDYAASLEYLGKHSEILADKEIDGLLVLAFNEALEKNYDLCRQYIHQGLLLQYCRALGKDGVALFFDRITTKGHQAQGVFFKDVQDTFMRIKNRSVEILAERAKEGEGVEQIQLHAVEPGTVINIKVPPADSEDADVQEARKIFEAFSSEMRAALETGELDEVNKVLGGLSIDEAEEMVNWFGEVCADSAFEVRSSLTNRT